MLFTSPWQYCTLKLMKPARTLFPVQIWDVRNALGLSLGLYTKETRYMAFKCDWFSFDCAFDSLRSWRHPWMINKSRFFFQCAPWTRSKPLKHDHGVYNDIQLCIRDIRPLLQVHHSLESSLQVSVFYFERFHAQMTSCSVTVSSFFLPFVATFVHGSIKKKKLKMSRKNYILVFVPVPSMKK